MEGSTGNVWNCILKFWCLALLRFPPRAAIWAWLQLSWIFVGHLGTCGLSLPLNFHPLIWLFRFYLFVRVSNVFSSLFFFTNLSHWVFIYSYGRHFSSLGPDPTQLFRVSCFPGATLDLSNGQRDPNIRCIHGFEFPRDSIMIVIIIVPLITDNHNYKKAKKKSTKKKNKKRRNTKPEIARRQRIRRNT